MQHTAMDIHLYYIFSFKTNQMTKQTALSIIAVFWLLSIICGGVAGFFLYPHVYPCNSNVGSVIVSVTDSFAPAKDTVPIIWQPLVKKVETRKYSPDASHNNGTLSGDSRTINNHNDKQLTSDSGHSTIVSVSALCLDTNIYKQDTLSVDNFRATSTAYVTNNELIKLQVEWINLKPELWKIKRETITVEKKQSIVKVYTGLYGGVAIANKTVASYHGGIGLDAIISDRHLIGLQGGLNSSLQPEVGIRFSEKIRLKK